MAYITLVNTYHSEADEVAKNAGGVKVEKFYNYCVASSNPTDLLDNLSRVPSSSLTLQTSPSLIRLERECTLLLTDPKKQIAEAHEVKGAYDAIHSSKEDKRTQILKDQGVKGFLEITLERELDLPNTTEELTGKNYAPGSRPKIGTVDDARAYLAGAKDLAEFMDQFNPTIIYAPLRGANPIVKAMVWQGDRPRRVYFPVTSSFVRGGRANNKREITKLQNEVPDFLERLLYVEEIVSGGMTRGHLRELISALRERIAKGQVQLKVAGLVHLDGRKLTQENRAYLERKGEYGDAKIKGVPNVFTLDDAQALGIHYVNYDLGPHSVPYLEGERYSEKRALLQDTFSRNV